MGVVLLTDSGSDISPAKAREYGIEVLPLWMVYKDERLRDGVDITRATFYSRLSSQSELPHTEPIDEAAFDAAFARHVEAGDDVVATLVSSGLSETYKHAAAAARRFGAKVHVVDSQSFSGGILLQAMAAAEMLKSGAGAAEIAAALERAKAAQHGFLIMPDITYLGRSGRLNKAIVALGTVLKVVPILQLKNGAVETAAQTRSYEKAKDLLVDIVTRNAPNASAIHFAVGHTNAPELGESIATAIKKKLGVAAKSFLVYEGGPAVALHGGPGAIGVFSLAGI